MHFNSNPSPRQALMWRDLQLKFGLVSPNVQTIKFAIRCFVLLQFQGNNRRGLLLKGGKFVFCMFVSQNSYLWTEFYDISNCTTTTT